MKKVATLKLKDTAELNTRVRQLSIFQMNINFFKLTLYFLFLQVDDLKHDELQQLERYNKEFIQLERNE